jgi:hypothetical protein
MQEAHTVSRIDISFLKKTTEQVLMPLEITGTCTGIATLMQKVTTLMMADKSDPTRNYGGSLGALLEGNNPSDTAVLSNYFQQAADEVSSTLKEEQDLNLHDMPDSEILSSLRVDSVTITAKDSVSVSYIITSKAGEVDHFKVNIPIITGE